MSDLTTNNTMGRGLTFLRRIASSPDESLFLAKTEDDSVVFVKRAEIAYRYDKHRRETYVKECELASALDHPNLARCLGLEEIDGEFMQLMYVPRCISLSRMYQLCSSRSERLPIEIGLHLAREITSALKYLYAHVFGEKSRNSPLHIALRPETLFVNDQGHCQIVQFNLQQPPSLVGTIVQKEVQPYLIYSAPEQCVGGVDPDYRADFFTLGILFYELFTSKALFSISGTIDETLISRRKIRCLHPLLSDVDPDLSPLDDLITGLLQPLPDDRINDLTIIETALSDIGTYRGSAASDSDVGAYVREILDEEINPAAPEDRSGHSRKPSILTEIAEYNDS